MADQATDQATATKPTEKLVHERGIAKTLEGVVKSAKMTKTVVVEVVRRVAHPQYGKFVMHRKRYKAHDEHSTSKVGDRVIIVETRPISKEKRWKIAKTLVKAQAT